MASIDKPQEVAGTIKAPGWLLSGIVMGLLGTGTTWAFLGAKSPAPVAQSVDHSELAKKEAAVAARAVVDEVERKAEANRIQERQELVAALTAINGKLDESSKKYGEIAESLAEIRGRLKLPPR
jgi:hypothetical protein